MTEYTKEDNQEALRPIESLISKSEKALKKLKPGTWQHTMLRDNIRALHLAAALMEQGEDSGQQPNRDDLKHAMTALSSMIGKAENAKAKFAPGTSHHSLQRNRLKALRIAHARVKAELNKTARADST